MSGNIIHRHHRLILWSIATVLMAALVVTPAGRGALAWAYLQSIIAIERATHVRAFSLDRFDSTCPHCM